MTTEHSISTAGDNLGKYPEIELVDLGSLNVAGGTTPSSRICITISLRICPTTACTRAC
jgi:hypothetical protein